MEIRYGDKVEITKGFYKGAKGIITGKEIWLFFTYYQVDFKEINRNCFYNSVLVSKKHLKHRGC